jgi:hypothetical protein
MSTSRNPGSRAEILSLGELPAQHAKVEAQWDKTYELREKAHCEGLLNYDDDTTVSLKAELRMLDFYIKDYREMLGEISIADIASVSEAAAISVDEVFQTLMVDMQEIEDSLQFYETWINAVWMEIDL